MTIKSENELIRELLNQKLLSSADIELIYEYQKKSNLNFIQAIIESKVIAEDTILSLVASFLNITFVPDLAKLTIDEKCFEKVPAKYATRYKILPIGWTEEALSICLSNPFDIQTIDDVRTILNCPLKLHIARERDINIALDTYYGVGAGAIERLQAEKPAKEIIPTVTYEKIDDVTSEASIVTFVNQILYDAQKSRATDIHIEPYEHDIKIRYRIDGVLHDIKVPRHIKQFQSSLITRIKILATLDISEHRLPQDGRIKIATNEGTLDLRVSIMPTPFGESINIRLLSATELLHLDQLGFSPRNLAIIEQAITKSHGVIFLTGPTGSGKTTTLYACLNKINDRNKKIITIEDPIEYQLDGITQIQVHPKINLTFSNGLRSILRHDPDIIMVGEVRDSETAEIAIRASLTGHLVFSTLHTNDAPSAIARLLDMNVEQYLISSSLECVIAQRLVRLLCNSCKKKIALNVDDAKKIGIDDVNSRHVYTSVGCPECAQTGYKSRTAIVEIMVLNDDISELINKRSSYSSIKKSAIANGMQTLRQDGWDKVMNGITTIEEIVRVTEETT